MTRIEFDIHLMLIIYISLTCNFDFFVLKKRDLYNNIIWSASKTVKQQDLMNKADN